MAQPTIGSDWDDVKLRLPIGAEVVATVTRVVPYGVWVDLGVGFDGLLLVPEMTGDGPRSMEDYPPAGTSIRAKVLWHNDMRKQLSLTQRG
jgi:ribosomal protein S1